MTPPTVNDAQKLAAKKQRELKANKSSSPAKPTKPHSVCNICKDDNELRESLKNFDLSDFNSKTIKLQELDAELTDRINQINNVNLRIQHLLLSEPAFTEE